MMYEEESEEDTDSSDGSEDGQWLLDPEEDGIGDIAAVGNGDQMCNNSTPKDAILLSGNRNHIKDNGLAGQESSNQEENEEQASSASAEAEISFFNCSSVISSPPVQSWSSCAPRRTKLLIGTVVAHLE